MTILTRTTPRLDDSHYQHVVLIHLLTVDPAPVAIDELVRELGDGTPEDDDALRRAVRDLHGTGLLHHGDDLIVPTRAAARAAALLDTL